MLLYMNNISSQYNNNDCTVANCFICTIDIDECNEDMPCDTKADCTDTIGFYTCICQDGYEGTGLKEQCHGKWLVYRRTTWKSGTLWTARQSMASKFLFLEFTLAGELHLLPAVVSR